MTDFTESFFKKNTASNGYATQDYNAFKKSMESFDFDAYLKQLEEERKRQAEQQKQLEEQQKNAGLFKSGSGNLVEGYLNTMLNIGSNIGQGAFRTLEGVADTAQYAISSAANFWSGLGNSVLGEGNLASDIVSSYGNWLQENAKANSTASLFGLNENEQENLLNSQYTKDIREKSYLGEFGESVAQGIGNVAAMAGMGAVTGGIAGGLGLTTTAGELSGAGKILSSAIPSFTSAYGNSRSEAYKNGASDSESHKFAMINGFAEAISEQFFEGMPGIKSAGWGDKLTGKLADIATNVFNNKYVGKAFLKIADAAGEGFEEIISNALVALGTDIAHGIDNNYNYGMEELTGNGIDDFLKQFTAGDSWESFLSAALTSAILGAGSTIINTTQRNQIINAFAKDNNMSFKEAKALLGEQVEETTKQVEREELDYDSNIEKQELAEQRILKYMESSKGENIETKLREAVIKEAQERGIELSEEEIKQEMKKYRTTTIDKINNPERYRQFTQETDNEKDKELVKSIQEAGLSDTKKNHKLYDFVKTLSDNSELNYKIVNNDIIKDMGVDVEGKTINGFNKDGTVYINANSKNALEQVAYHEIAHSIKSSNEGLYNELKGLVYDLKGKEDLKEYMNLYGVKEGEISSNLTDDIEDEYINDKLGELLNDNEFLTKLNDNRTLLQKIIDEIKRIVGKIKGDKKLLQTQEKLEKLYKQGLEGIKTETQEDETLPFSLSVEEAQTGEDNDGNKLSQGQIDYFKNSKATDSNGNLIKVYHTTTGKLSQFNEFNPVGTDFYRFGDQVVNYYTDNQDMSGSYADQNYKKAYTKPIKTLEDVNNFIEFQNKQNDDQMKVNGITNHYTIEKDGDAYILKQNPSGIEFLGYNNLSNEGKVALDRVKNNENLHDLFLGRDNYIQVLKSQLEDWYNLRGYDGYPELAQILDMYDKETTKLIASADTLKEQTILKNIFKNDLEKWLFDTERFTEQQKQDVINRGLTKAFNSEQELIDNIQNEFIANYQYSGYVNLTNPYIIDTFGENWNTILTERDINRENEYRKVVKDNETKEKLFNLAQESNDKFKEYNKSNEPREYAEYSIIKNKIKSSELRDVVNDMSMFNLTYEGWLEAGQKNAELFGEEYKQTLPNGDELISNYVEDLNPAERELIEGKTISQFVNEYGKLYENNINYGSESSWFKKQLFKTIGQNLNTDAIGYSNLYNLARYNFDGSMVDDFLSNSITTNDLVKRIIEKNKSGETNYDGIIMKNVYDYGGQSKNSYRTTGNLYVTFDSNQFKAEDNLNPTENQDIRYSLSTQDSQGRELSKEQQDYFTNSKVRDAEGRLIPMYHGTTGEFNEFDRDLAGNHGTYYGAGFYFTKDLDSAKDYAKMSNGEQGRVIESYLNITNPYIPTADTINEDGSVSFAPSFYEDFENRFKDDVNLITDWDTLTNRQKGRAVRNILQDNGYDGVINGDNYVVFESNQIKNIDNTNPTSSPDIRYSLGDYRGSHQIENSQSITDLDINDIKNKVIELNGYLTRQDQTDLSKLKKILNNPEEKVKIYRASPVNELNNGDWVTTDKSYAQNVANNNGGKVYTYEVNANELYYPDNVSELPSLHRLSSFQYNGTDYSISNETQQEQNNVDFTIKDYNDYLKTLPSYAKLEERAVNNEELRGILTKEDYKNKKIELFEREVDKADTKMEEQAKRFARENLELTRKASLELQNIIDKYKGLTREDIFNSEAKNDIREFVKNNSRQEFVEEVISEDIRDLQKAIRKTEFFISKDSAGEFADGITAFKKNNPGIKIKYGKPNIDSVYQELAETYPGMLETDVNDKDIPFILAEFLKKPYRQFDNSNVQVFELNDNEINNITNKIYKALTNNAISDEQIEQLTQNISQKVEDKYARAMATEKYREIARNTIDLEDIKDKKRGIQYKINTMKRNLNDIMSKEQAQLWYNTYFKPITIHNAQIEVDKQDYVERIQKYGLTNDESTYTQMLGELKYNPETTLTTDQVESYAEKHNIDKQKCSEAVEEFRNIYDELIERVNESLKANGYKPIDYRKGYFPHFIEDKPTSLIGKLADKFGWKIQKGTLPTDIAGITEGFKPGKTWASFAQQRTGDATDYNALKGMDNYLRGAMDLIYHTEDIQKLRALENEIRYQYSSEGVQQQIDEIYANQDLSAEEKAQQIALLTENLKDNPLGNLVTELRDYTNSLANKKSILDRGMEQALGRDTYSIMNNITGRVSANMVGANISSAMTNFIPITQAWSQVSTKNLLRGMYESIKNTIKSDGFDENSVYLTNRTQQAENLYKTTIDKLNDKLGIPFEAVDSFASNTIVRAKYYENLDKGMSEQEAMSNADEFAKDVMAGRSKGDQPTIFNSKNPIYKLFTAFQLEVNNQYGYMFKDLPKDMADEGKEKLAAAFVKMFLGAFLYNLIAEKLTGRKSAFSPIDMAIDDIKTATNDNLDLAAKIENIAKDTAQEAPFISGIMGGGRLPIQAAIPYDDPLSMVLSTGENIGNLFNEEKKDTAINSLKKEWLKPLYYIALPVAGGQIKKTNEGLAMYNENLPIAGSYTDAGKLRFEADTSTLGRLQAAVFGQYASENAREYFDKGYSPLSEKQVNEAMDANLPIGEYREINSGIANAKKIAKDEGTSQTEAEYNYIYNLPISMEQKNALLNDKLGTGEEIKDENGYVKYKDNKDNVYWVDESTGTIYNNKYRESSIDKDKLTKYSNKKDLTNYGDYSSLEEFNYANNNPTKYAVIKQITDYGSYKTYKNDIESIKQNYNDGTTKGQNAAKQKVFEYINSLALNQYQKLMLQKLAGGYSIKSYQRAIRSYIEGLEMTASEKQQLDKELFG